MRNDSPSPPWYEPPDLIDVDHDDVSEPEALMIAHGIVSWCAILTDDDD